MSNLNNIIKKLKLNDKNNYLALDKITDENAFLDGLAFSLNNGADFIVFDPQAYNTQEAIKLGKKIKHLCAEFQATFIIQERVDIAFTIEADGALLNTNSFTTDQARELLGENALIGILCTNLDEYNFALSTNADFIKTLNFVKPNTQTSKKIF